MGAFSLRKFDFYIYYYKMKKKKFICFINKSLVCLKLKLELVPAAPKRATNDGNTPVSRGEMSLARLDAPTTLYFSTKLLRTISTFPRGRPLPRPRCGCGRNPFHGPGARVPGPVRRRLTRNGNAPDRFLNLDSKEPSVS